MRQLIEDNLISIKDFKRGQQVELLYVEPIGVTDNVKMTNGIWLIDEIRRFSKMGGKTYAHVAVVRLTNMSGTAKAVDLRDLRVIK